MRPELPPKFPRSAAFLLVLLLCALMAARTETFKRAWNATSISPAFADGHRGGGSDGSSSRGGDGGGSGDRGGGGGGGGDGGGGGNGGSGSGSGGDGSGGYGGGQRGGGDGGGEYTYSGYGYGYGNGYGGYGSGGGYTNSGSGGGSTVPHGDGKPPSVGIPLPELRGLPKELGRDLGKDNSTWEKLLTEHLGSHYGTKESEREAERVPGGNGLGEGAGRDRQKISPPVKGAGSQPPAIGGAFSTRIDPGSYSRTEVLAGDLSSAGIARAKALGFQIGGPGQHGAGHVTVMTVPQGLDALQAMRLLEQSLPGEHFQLNRLYRLYQPATKEDREARPGSPATLGGKKCGTDRCYAQAAIQWKDHFSACARDVKIGVIDTGFDLHHPAFKGQKIAQRPFLPEGKSPSADWHGTGVLALLAGRPDSGTPGLVPDATYYAASIFYADESGGSVTDTASFLRALDWMSDSGVALVNMSFTGPQDDLVQKKIESLSARGFVFAAAAGNDGPTAEPAYPAAYPQVIAVTAVTKDLRNYPYANRGAHIDVAAPGVDIWTAWPESREGYRSGTSFASPFVTGVLAIYPPDVLRAPKDTLLEHVNITDLGPPGRDPIYGRGLLQAPASCQHNSSEVAELGLGTAGR